MSIHYDAGRYKATIVDHGLGMTGTGKPQVIIRVQINGRTDGAQCEQYERTVYRAVTDATAPYLKKDLEAIGFAGAALSSLSRESATAVDLTGREIEVDCKHGTNQDNEPREEWGIAWAGAGGPLTEKPMDAAGLRKLDAMFGRCVPKGEAPAKAAPQAPADEPWNRGAPEDSEVPF